MLSQYLLRVMSLRSGSRLGLGHDRLFRGKVLEITTCREKNQIVKYQALLLD